MGSCDDENNKILAKAREIEKLAFAAATTIISLIPLLISVPTLPTASVLELLLTGNHSIAIITAGLTFGLTVAQKACARAVKSEDYLREEFTWDPHDTGHTDPRHRKCLYNALFIVVQLIIVATPIVLSHTVKSDSVRTVWGCRGVAHTLWHVGFFLPVPIVGPIWYLFLRLTYHFEAHSKGTRRLVVYFRREGMDILGDLLPGFSQILMTVYLTFLFCTIYGVSVETALVRVIIVATFLLLSRAVSLWFSRAMIQLESTLLIRCENLTQMGCVLEKWNREGN